VRARGCIAAFKSSATVWLPGRHVSRRAALRRSPLSDAAARCRCRILRFALNDGPFEMGLVGADRIHRYAAAVPGIGRLSEGDGGFALDDAMNGRCNVQEVIVVAEEQEVIDMDGDPFELAVFRAEAGAAGD
jgi:hypothetical protein